jgi:hypothetical protein
MMKIVTLVESPQFTGFSVFTVIQKRHKLCSIVMIDQVKCRDSAHSHPHIMRMWVLI